MTLHSRGFVNENVAIQTGTAVRFAREVTSVSAPLACRRWKWLSELRLFYPNPVRKTSLDVSPAEFVAKVTVAVDGGGPAQAASICSQNCRKRKQLAVTDVALEQRTIRD
jgi:hypothetical protein